MHSRAGAYLRRFSAALAMAGAICLLVSLGRGVAGQEIAATVVSPSVIVWQPHVSYQALDLRISMPGGEVVQRMFELGETVAFENDGSLSDGSYTCELRVTPSSESLIQTDYFTIYNGSFVTPVEEE